MCPFETKTVTLMNPEKEQILVDNFKNIDLTAEVNKLAGRVAVQQVKPWRNSSKTYEDVACCFPWKTYRGCDIFSDNCFCVMVFRSTSEKKDFFSTSLKGLLLSFALSKLILTVHCTLNIQKTN